jgi:hypothetical protein
MMVKMFADRVDKIMPRREWDFIARPRKRAQALKAGSGRLENPKAKDWDNPHRSSASTELDEWQPADPTSVYFDEASEFIADEIKRYNRIAVIIQGLFDRSLVLHPHQPVQVWNPISFEGAVELIYDNMTLTHGDKPDFEAYRAKLNKTMGPESIVTGQEDFWLRAMAERGERSRKRLAEPIGSARTTPATALWQSGTGSCSGWTSGRPAPRRPCSAGTTSAVIMATEPSVTSSIDVPADELLNVSAYTPGDYKRFFADPRTRQEYLKWAPLMLAAEDYHAGLAELGAESKARDNYRSY